MAESDRPACDRSACGGDQMIDIEDVLLSIPHQPTSDFLVSYHHQLTDFRECVADAWFDLRFARRHRYLWHKGRCTCGWRPRTNAAIELQLISHREIARDEEW